MLLTNPSFDAPVDLLVIGAGIAGGTAALKAARAGLHVILLCRSADLLASNTAWAQGGIIYEGENDSAKLLADDIFEAGAQLGNLAAIRQLAEEGPRRIREILLESGADPDGTPGRGVSFDRDAAGHLALTEEAAHSLPRIIHAEDLTGRAIQDFLNRALLAEPNVRVVTRATAVDLLTLSHHGSGPEDAYAPATCVGAYVLLRDEHRVVTIRARETLLATGGCGQLYRHTTNPPSARGDGIAMCWRAGVRLQHMEYIQFHPTSLYTETGRRFLISEAVRGEGGRLVDAEGRDFMQRYDKRGSLAPRDVVARAIHEEMLASGHHCVYLDITHKPADWLRERFPNITETCAKAGVDLTRQPIPVVPAAHYMCGGVLVDLDGRTTTRRLWAVGEVSCTGVHGANRLASTSLLEGLVWGARAAEAIAATAQSGVTESYRMPEVAPWEMAEEPPDPALIQQDWNTIRYTMWNYVGLVRTTKRLRRAGRLLRELELEVEDFYAQTQVTDELLGLRNALTAARAITSAALSNRRSRGCHYRV